MAIFLPKKIIGNMFDHSLNLDPEEACGVLLGNKNQISENIRIKNIHEEPLTRYTMDPNELLKVTLESEKKDLDIIGFYHSHVYTQAYPSSTDIKEAITHSFGNPVNYYYILISLVEKNRPIMRAFKIDLQKNVHEEQITFDGDQYRS